MKLSDLKTGQTVTGRIGKHTTGDAPNWSEYQDLILYVQRRPDNSIATIIATNVQVSEFDESTYEGKGIFNSEGYLMEIKGLS